MVEYHLKKERKLFCGLLFTEHVLPLFLSIYKDVSQITLGMDIHKLAVKDPIRVLVTGAAGQLAYFLLYIICSGYVFGSDQPIILHLLDISKTSDILTGVVMELYDCAFPLLCEIVPTDDEKIAFSGIDVAFLVGSKPLDGKMKERKELLATNIEIFRSQGRALDSFAKKSVKVLVVANPTNTMALVCSMHAPSIPKENFTALSRTDHNRIIAQIASKLNVHVSDVSNVIVWGNHSSTQYPDVSHATVVLNGNVKTVPEAINDEKFIREDLISIVQGRAFAISSTKKRTSATAMSSAKAAGDHMRDWFQGTEEGHFVSMAVYSDGSYGVPRDVMYCFPVTISTDGIWKIVQGLTLDEFSITKLNISGEELLEEKSAALSLCKD